MELALETVRAQSPGQIRWLGADSRGNGWRLPVLNESFDVDLTDGRIRTAGGAEVGDVWRILTLHYLSVTARPEGLAPEIAFADLASARSYAGVYQQRAVARLCGVFGRDSDRLRAAAVGLGGRAVEGGDAAFEFDVFPRIRLRLVWHAADEEFPPSATWLLPANIESWFATEDVVVLSERLASRLAGRPF